MKIEIIEINTNDDVMIMLPIGNTPPNEIDGYVERCMPKLKATFGCPISVIPTRDGGWDFTIIRNPNRKKEKSYANTLRKRTFSRRDR